MPLETLIGSFSNIPEKQWCCRAIVWARHRGAVLENSYGCLEKLVNTRANKQTFYYMFWFFVQFQKKFLTKTGIKWKIWGYRVFRRRRPKISFGPYYDFMFLNKCEVIFLISHWNLMLSKFENTTLFLKHSFYTKY